MDSLMTVKDAAQYLKLNYMTVYKLAQKGKIPASKVGGNWRFKKEILDEWLASQCVGVERVVLVVDDDARIRDLLKYVILKRGYKVITAESGEKAVEEVEKRHFDLIFLDLVLPGLSGVEVLQMIKAKDEKAVIVVITGYGNDPIALEALSLGPLLLMRKPLDISAIIKVLDLGMKVMS